MAVFGLTYHRQIWAILTQETARDAFIGWARGSGLMGVGVFLGIQILQVVVAVLPGEAVELAAGLIYGTWGGLALCLLGVFVSSVLIYYTVRALGARASAGEALKKYKFLRDEEHIEFALFLLFFIPGTPKDLLTYAGPFSAGAARALFPHQHAGAHPVHAVQHVCGLQLCRRQPCGGRGRVRGGHPRGSAVPLERGGHLAWLRRRREG